MRQAMPWPYSRVDHAFTAACKGAAAAFVLLACSTQTAGAQPIDAPPRVDARATIRTTSHGVPHVLASDFVGLGFGAGYAQATHAVCEMAGRFLTVSAERSLFLGPDTPVPDGPARVRNLDSDFFWKRIIDARVVDGELRKAAPLGPSRDDRDLARGFAAGYNAYLQEVGIDKLSDPRCRGAAWVRPIGEREVYLRAMHWNLFRSGGAMMAPIVAASPTGTPASTAAAEIVDSALELAHGSNMIALGAEATDNGQGMLFANPHWFWEGPDSWVEMQLTIPGKLNVIGMQTIGLPVIQTGFNEHVAWAGTSSFATRYTFYRLALVPGSRTSYRVDDRVHALTPRVVEVKVRTPGGAVESRRHTFWESSMGLAVSDSDMPWTDTHAFVMRDVGYTFRWLGQQLRINMARSTAEIADSGRAFMAIGWRNLAAADRNGDVFYGDRTAVPAVSTSLATTCAVATDEPRETRRGTPILLLDGSRSACQWATVSGAPVPGIFSADELPQLRRRDYVLQSNDTHWLNNLRQPLEGYPSIMGSERTARTLRTRNAVRKVEGRLSGTDGHPGRTFSLPLLQAITMDNRVFSADIWLEDVARLGEEPAAAPDLVEASRVLRAWDRTEHVDSAGALLWRRFVDRLSTAVGRAGLAELSTVPFDVREPILTPRGLRVEDPRVRTALATAIADLRDSAIPLDASLRGYQYAIKGDTRIPISGGSEASGQYNRVDSRNGWTPGRGYPDVNNGSSFLMWMQFTPAGPVGHSIMTMSQSRNPASPYFADQTRLWSNLATKRMLFSEADIAADPSLRIDEVCGGAGCSPRRDPPKK